MLLENIFLTKMLFNLHVLASGILGISSMADALQPKPTSPPLTDEVTFSPWLWGRQYIVFPSYCGDDNTQIALLCHSAILHAFCFHFVLRGN